jgi:glycosyltransferase involved in cell wall biosynthesis
MVDEMLRLGCEVATTPWSHRLAGESLPAKVADRTADMLRVRRRLKERPGGVMLVTTTHDWPALLRDIPLMALTRGRCRARVIHFHGSMVDRLVRPGNTLMKVCSRWLVRQCDAVLVLSEEERRLWTGFSPETRFEVVVNPFVPPPASELTASPKEPPALLFVGRLIPEKGVYDLLEALCVVRAQTPCTLRIAGKGPEEAAIRRRVAELGLQDSVDLVGYLEGDALAALYASSSVFVLPTYFGEGFPTVITEAMSYGLPVVTTPTRGAADLLGEGENALFIPPHRPAELAVALGRLLKDPLSAADMGRRNRERVRAFAPEVVVPRYVEIMWSLID